MAPQRLAGKATLIERVARAPVETSLPLARAPAPRSEPRAPFHGTRPDLDAGVERCLHLVAVRARHAETRTVPSLPAGSGTAFHARVGLHFRLPGHLFCQILAWGYIFLPSSVPYRGRQSQRELTPKG